jgi:hypothetical protein
VVVMMIVLIITTAVVVATVAVGLAGIWRRHHQRTFSKISSEPSGDPFIPFLFDRPSRWMAVRCSNIVKVQNALHLHNPTPCSLTEGFSKLNERKLFVSPAVKGWILVVGNSLPDAGDDVDKLYLFLMKIASELGSVQYFSSNRVLNHHSWVRIENNRVYRAYAWAGETMWNQGDLTAAERELDMKCYEYGSAPLPFPFTARDSNVATTDKVMQLAARWSIDPMVVNSQNLKATLGIAGDLKAV